VQSENALGSDAAPGRSESTCRTPQRGRAGLVGGAALLLWSDGDGPARHHILVEALAVRP